MNTKARPASVTARRDFLTGLSLTMTGSMAALAQAAQGENTRPVPRSSLGPPLPTIHLGKHRITRLVVGSNPISGYSYMGPTMDRHMKEYFTQSRIIELLSRCEEAGITAHQFSDPQLMTPILRRLRERGTKMKFFCLHAGGGGRMPVKQLVQDTRPIAVVHHGGVTDRLFREGKAQEVHDFVKRVRDAGVLAGVSAHNPDCIKRIADEGWPVDLFMACFYYITRTPEETQAMPPIVTEQVGRPFFASDPATMCQVLRQVDQPCLGFKILAAGRKCYKKESVEAAFKFAFEHLKPTDGVIVGMYPRYQAQIQENAQYTRQFAVV
jgi:hypothetical protein